MNLSTVGDVTASKSWMEIMEELPECWLLKEVEHFILGDNELDQMVDQASRGEWCNAWLAGK